MENIFILIGDSLTFGYGVPSNDRWTYNLSKRIPIKIINKGINGNTTVNMLDRFYNDVTSKCPKYVFIMGGTNDLLTGKSVSSIIKNLVVMIEEIKPITQNIYIGIPPRINKDMAEKLFSPSDFYDYCSKSLPILRKNIINLCNENSINYIDFYKLTNDNFTNNIYLDGIHLNSLGNTLMLSEILKRLKF